MASQMVDANRHPVNRESLRLSQKRDRALKAFWSKVRKKVAVAQKQAAEGKVVDGEKAMRQIIDELSAS